MSLMNKKKQKMELDDTSKKALGILVTALQEEGGPGGHTKYNISNCKSK